MVDKLVYEKYHDFQMFEENEEQSDQDFDLTIMSTCTECKLNT